MSCLFVIIKYLTKRIEAKLKCEIIVILYVIGHAICYIYLDYNDIVISNVSLQDRDNGNKNEICIPIIYNNPLIECFSNNKYMITILTRPTQIVYF